MAAESDLYTALSGAGAVTSLTGTRLYSDIRDQEDDVPAVFWQRSGTEVLNNIHGTTPVGEITSLVVVCFDETREACEVLADAVQSAAITAGFLYSGRQGDYNSELDVYATILDLSHRE